MDLAKINFSQSFSTVGSHFKLRDITSFHKHGMPSKRLRLSNKDLEDLEGRVTQHLLSKIGTIVTKKCKEFFNDKCSDVLNEPLAIQQEIETLKSNLMSLKNDFKFLNNKEDSTIGSLSFVASEYHDFRKKLLV